MWVVTPAVSVIMATYNRSDLLVHAIKTVQLQLFTEWELIVVGDACTDDTAEVMAQQQDPRIRFVNLERNSGEQSEPNNHGLSLARGAYIAFLNQDDLWFPDHLGRLVVHLEQTGADLVWSPYFSMLNLPPQSAQPWLARLDAVPHGQGFQPSLFVVASAWLFRRSLIEKVGPWRSSREFAVPPSQEWLFRAHLRGVLMSFQPLPTLLVVFSGARPLSYRNRVSNEHRYYLEQLASSDAFRHALLAQAAVDAASTVQRWRVASPCKSMAHLVYALWNSFCLRWRIHPMGLRYALRFGRKGGFIRHIRKKVGL
jgi:glycosyltransferase involved in cell wall biosynthesis